MSSQPGPAPGRQLPSHSPHSGHSERSTAAGVHGVCRVRGARIRSARRSGPAPGCGVRIGISPPRPASLANASAASAPRLAPGAAIRAWCHALSRSRLHKPEHVHPGIAKEPDSRTAAPGRSRCIAARDSSGGSRDPDRAPSPTSRGRGDPRVLPLGLLHAAARRVSGSTVGRLFGSRRLRYVLTPAGPGSALGPGRVAVVRYCTSQRPPALGRSAFRPGAASGHRAAGLLLQASHAVSPRLGRAS